MSPLELQKVLSSGLLSFPITDFQANGDFDAAGYAKRLQWLAPYGATALFAAGGTGEFFSLEPKEYSAVIKTAVDTCDGLVPILAGAGAWLAIVLFNKQAFCNYYWLVVGLLCAATAASTAASRTRGVQPAARIPEAHGR